MSLQRHRGLIFSSILKPFAVSLFFPFFFERTRRGKQDPSTTEALIAFLFQSESELLLFFFFFSIYKTKLKRALTINQKRSHGLS